ncbi:gamma-glutamylcyclotransferase [Seohaeicola saemankumensis]|nr:flavoprotein [Seohaeicola saemankumensis]MCA0873989.1 gamma-glutamylcyclotransferase [Seohaeicola saemankumensis]
MAIEQEPSLANSASVSGSEWAMILPVFHSDSAASEAERMKPHFAILKVFEDTVLPASGMYIVLQGQVALRQNGKALATADPGDYFYEEHLEIFDIPVSLEAVATSGTKLAYLSSEAWFDLPENVRAECFATLFGDLVAVHMQNFQQPINCCSVTAAALSMSALGFSCEVNDIFRECQLPTSYVINDGISLAELYDVACTYIHKLGLRETVQVQAYFMDEATTSVDLLLEAIDESNRMGGDNDILVANFQVGMAHGKPTMPGGHFAIIAKCNPRTGLVHMMDVHPEKYGKLWVTTTDRLYHAMSDRDGTSMRSRGILRFSARQAVSTRLQCLNQPCNYVDTTRYLSSQRNKSRNLFRRASPNLNSVGVLAESLAILGDAQASEDKLLLYSTAAYSETLSRVSTAREMDTIATLYLSQSTDIHLASEFRGYSDRPAANGDMSPEDWFKAQLLSLNAHDGRHLMINIDLNRVLGFEAIKPPENVYRETALLEEFWCLCIAFDEESDLVTVVDMSPATSQVWQAPQSHLFRGLRDIDDPAMLVLEERAVAKDPTDVAMIVEDAPIALFYDDEDPWSHMLRNILANIGITELRSIDVSGHGASAMKMRRQLTAMTGKDTVPYFFFKGDYLGKRADIVDMVLNGTLQQRIHDAGLPVLLRHQSPSLDKNIFGYPKGGLTEAPNGKRNVLLCACGSSAADKIPELVDRITDAGHNVKLIPSVSAEKFFRDFGAERILNKISHNDYYRDDDEWNFRYIEFGMPLRASHLALCDWADCVIVAPITCNTMGKVANGIADNLLTSVFVAWQYQKKPVILCPACNTNMWKNITTQNNVDKLKTLGVDFAGPREGILSNGTKGVGMMATPDQIMLALEEAFEELDDQEHRIIKWAQEAAASDDYTQWKRVFRAIDENVVGIDIIDEHTGDTLLHYAAGGEGEMNENGLDLGLPDLQAAKDLIARGINVNAVNDHGFTSLHVAMMNDSVEMVDILLQADGIDATACLRFMERAEVSDVIRAKLLSWAEAKGVEASTPAETGSDDAANGAKDEPQYLYFTYGSLKRGFPNHETHADVLSDYLGEAVTRQSMPLIVPKEPFCDNPNCPYLHRMAVLADIKGRGKQVHGEVYRVTASGLRELDKLEGYHGPGSDQNVYLRKKINVVIDGATEPAYVYVIADADEYLAKLEDGHSEMLAEYTLDMAQGELKPEYSPAQ